MAQDAIVKRNGADRAEIEARRGIVRDENGKIVRSKEWRVARISYLQAKIDTFAVRTKNAKAEIKALEKSI